MMDVKTKDKSWNLSSAVRNTPESCDVPKQTERRPQNWGLIVDTRHLSQPTFFFCCCCCCYLSSICCLFPHSGTKGTFPHHTVIKWGQIWSYERRKQPFFPQKKILFKNRRLQKPFFCLATSHSTVCFLDVLTRLARPDANKHSRLIFQLHYGPMNWTLKKQPVQTMDALWVGIFCLSAINIFRNCTKADSEVWRYLENNFSSSRTVFLTSWWACGVKFCGVLTKREQ